MDDLVKKFSTLIVLIVGIAILSQAVFSALFGVGIVEVCIHSPYPILNHSITATDAYVGQNVYFVIRLVNFWRYDTTINGTVDIYDSSMNYIDSVTIPPTFIKDCQEVYLLLQWNSTGQDPGVYFAFSNVSYVGNRSIAVDDFNLYELPEPPPPPPPPPTFGVGGGGAGAAPARTCNTFYYSLSRDTERTYYLFRCDRVVVQNGVEVYTEASEIHDTHVYMLIYDESGMERSLWIPLNGYLILDVDNDGEDDLEIRYNELIQGQMASLTYRSLRPLRKPSIIAPIPEVLLPRLVELAKTWNFWIILFMGIIISVVVYLMVYWYRTKKKMNKTMKVNVKI